MELRPAEADALKRVIEEWRVHDGWELEAGFKGKTVGETTTFLSVAQRLEAKGLSCLAPGGLYEYHNARAGALYCDRAR